MTSKNYADIIREYERLKRLNQQLLEACKALLSHAENMLCELEDTDDLSEFPYIQHARAVIAKAETP